MSRQTLDKPTLYFFTLIISTMGFGASLGRESGWFMLVNFLFLTVACWATYKVAPYITDETK